MSDYFDLIPVNRNYADILDKQASIGKYMRYMFQRTNSMFEYDGLPESIPSDIFEFYIQANGCCAVTKVNDKLYAFFGGLGGPPNPYYRPTLYIVANPALQFSASLEIGKDCVLVKNDTFYQGLYPMFYRYAAQIAENDISIRSAQINSRFQTIISAQAGKDEAAANLFLSNLEAGKLGAIGENQFLDGVKVHPAGQASTNNITQLIELQQYLKASWFNDIGLNSNFNMKREAINEAETSMNNDALIPLIDNMLMCREKAVEEINTMYSTSISVKRSGAWELKYKEVLQDITGKPTDTDISSSEVEKEEEKIEDSGQPEKEVE
jgi:hypothetical protein